MAETIVSSEEILEYRSSVVLKMEKMGATKDEIGLLQYETVLNSIKNNRKPEDVAWAILQ